MAHKFDVLKIFAASLLIVIVSGCGGLNSDDGNENYDSIADIEYIESVENRAIETPDIDRIYRAIANFDRALSNNDLSEFERLYLTFWRGNAYTALNQLRRENGEEVNTEEAEKALRAYDAIIAFEGNDTYYEDALYRAGVVAFNDLNDPPRASKYWKKCAVINHAGCMNIAAFGYFSGQFGFEQNLELARDYHVGTVNSGTDYGCAGAYSAKFLAHMAVFLPDLEYEKLWDEWLNTAFSLQKEVANLHQNTNACGLEFMKLDAYLLHLANGRDETTILREILTSDAHSSAVKLANYFLGETEFQSIDLTVRGQNEIFICSLANRLLFHSNIKSHNEIFETVKHTILEMDIDQCGDGHQWVSILETAT